MKILSKFYAVLILIAVQANASVITPQIISGDRVNINNYPSFASLFLYLTPNFYSSQSFCGATIINARFAMTAAHCVVGNDNVLKYTVVSPQLEDESIFPDGNIQFSRVKAFYYPDGFIDKPPFNNDIALLELEQPLNVSDYSSLLSFTYNDSYPSGGDYVAIGHGLTYGTEPSGANSSTLLKTSLTFVNKSTCRNDFTYRLLTLRFVLMAHLIVALHTNTQHAREIQVARCIFLKVACTDKLD